jgi:lipoprotein-anchoring transpeptidase ErfK/SrfK
MMRSIVITMLLLAGIITAYYTVFFRPIATAPPPAVAAAEAPSAPSAAVSQPQRPGLLAAETPAADALKNDVSTTRPSTTNTVPSSGALGLMRIAMAALERDEPLEARAKLSEAMILGLPPAEAAEARTHLQRLAERTLFGPAILPHDPHVIAYVVQSGETLAKIAKDHKVTSNLLARINGIADKNFVRAGQRIKVIQGPFTAVVDSTTFDMDVYLGGTFAKYFKVGLGTDGSTPTGQWKVTNKLINPTYFPPRGGPILAADDPQNPLGERWIGLVGIEGSAVNQAGYGIHGTIEPESIGKNMSFGCVRLLNSDVEFLFDLLVEGHSTVVTR